MHQTILRYTSEQFYKILTTEVPKQGIKRSSCQYNGEIIKTYPQVTDESLCQRFCQALPDCLSYNFGKNSAECQLRTGNDKTCDQVIVEKWVTKEDVDNCWSGHPHSSTSSTTTTEVTTATTTKSKSDHVQCLDRKLLVHALKGPKAQRLRVTVPKLRGSKESLRSRLTAPKLAYSS